MNDNQKKLIEKLAEKNILASWNGPFLNCRVAIKSGSKIKWQRFSFAFDTLSDCQGSSPVGKTSGAYVETFQREASDLIVAFGGEVAELEV